MTKSMKCGFVFVVALIFACSLVLAGSPAIAETKSYVGDQEGKVT